MGCEIKSEKMTEEASTYTTKNIIECSICNKKINKLTKCDDCIELEKNFNKLKEKNTVKAKIWLKNQLK